MTAIQEPDLDQRISRIVSTLLRQERADSWLSSTEAAAHLRMSKHHFLRLCRRGDGPQSSGEGRRLQRWRRSVLDAWQEGRCNG
jgi:predicted DNA-binding transcriptional regulator AlpA